MLVETQCSEKNLFLSIKNNQEILKLGLKSFYKHFKKADRVVSHIEFDNGT